MELLTLGRFQGKHGDQLPLEIATVCIIIAASDAAGFVLSVVGSNAWWSCVKPSATTNKYRAGPKNRSGVEVYVLKECLMLPIQYMNPPL